MPIETAPKDGTRILIFEKYNDVPAIAYWRNNEWHACQWNYDTDGDACVIDKLVQELIAYWHPLPAMSLGAAQKGSE